MGERSSVDEVIHVWVEIERVAVRLKRLKRGRVDAIDRALREDDVTIDHIAYRLLAELDLPQTEEGSRKVAQRIKNIRHRSGASVSRRNRKHALRARPDDHPSSPSEEHTEVSMENEEEQRVWRRRETITETEEWLEPQPPQVPAPEIGPNGEPAHDDGYETDEE